MQSVTLQFPDILKLLDFQLLVKTEIVGQNLSHFTLTGHFTPADILIAIDQYGAQVVEDTLVK